MTAEIKTFPDPADLAAYINGLYATSTNVVVTVINKSVYLIQHD